MSVRLTFFFEHRGQRPIAWWLAGSLVALTAVGSLVPASPVYLPELMMKAMQYQDGHGHGYWRRALDSPDPATRWRAIHALGALGPEVADDVPALARILREDAKRANRSEAALALSKIGPAARDAVPALTQALSDPDYRVRMNATVALIPLGTAARPAVPALIRTLQDRRNQKNLGLFLLSIREMAAVAVGRASAGSADAVPALTQALEDAATYQMRVAAILGLGAVGAEARGSAPLLRAVLKEATGSVREAARDALQKIGAGVTRPREPRSQQRSPRQTS
jgi:HEAT repeat protein